MEEKNKESIKKEKKIEKKVKKFMKAVREFLKAKNGGVVPPEYECSLLILETYYQQFLQLSEEINSLDSYLVMGRYAEVPHPLLSARDKASMRLETMMKELGLTLRAQARLDIVEPSKGEENPLESFIKNKGIEKR